MPHFVSILLPGLDGTGQLFAPFIAAAPSHLVIKSQALPSESPRNYEQLAAWVIDRLPSSRLALIAESFSGPLALMVANRCSRVAAVVLCASFIESPLPVSFVRSPRFLWNQPPPITLLRLLLTGGDRTLADSVRRAIATVPADVIADRVASVLKVSVREELDALAAPLLCLRATRDRIVGARCTEKMRAAKPRAEFADVDAPHLLLQSSPSAAWAFIEPFLKRAENVDVGVG